MSGYMLAHSAFLSCWYASEWQSFVLKGSLWDLTYYGHTIDPLRMPHLPWLYLCTDVSPLPSGDGTGNKDAREGQGSGERDSVQDRQT